MDDKEKELAHEIGNGFFHWMLTNPRRKGGPLTPGSEKYNKKMKELHRSMDEGMGEREVNEDEE